MHSNRHLARRAFIMGQRKLDNLASLEDLHQAEQKFADAISYDDQFWRALGWKGYTIVRQHLEDPRAGVDLVEYGRSRGSLRASSAPRR